jgi:uncharacterized protein YkwD
LTKLTICCSLAVSSIESEPGAGSGFGSGFGCGSPFDMMKNAGVTYRWAGENIAGAASVDRAHNGLMNSEGHRANILNSNFTHIGIGIVPGGPYGMMFTQMFIGVN